MIWAIHAIRLIISPDHLMLRSWIRCLPNLVRNTQITFTITSSVLWGHIEPIPNPSLMRRIGGMAKSRLINTQYETLTNLVNLVERAAYLLLSAKLSPAPNITSTYHPRGCSRNYISTAPTGRRVPGGRQGTKPETHPRAATPIVTNLRTNQQSYPAVAALVPRWRIRLPRRSIPFPAVVNVAPADLVPLVQGWRSAGPDQVCHGGQIAGVPTYVFGGTITTSAAITFANSETNSFRSCCGHANDCRSNNRAEPD